MGLFTPEPEDERMYLAVIKALVLLVGQEQTGRSLVTLDGLEMLRAQEYELVVTRYQDPYQLKLQVTPK